MSGPPEVSSRKSSKKYYVMDKKIMNYFTSLLLETDASQKKIPYKLDNLFYEIFGMSSDEVLKNYSDSIDIMT